MYGTPTYKSWVGMIQRCTNPNDPSYNRYGAIGITVCDRWKDFRLFFEDLGERPKYTSLDRINNEKGYEPGNCVWATSYEQNNNKRTNKLITYNGKTQTLAMWARELKIDYGIFKTRVYRGQTIEHILKVCGGQAV